MEMKRLKICFHERTVFCSGKYSGWLYNMECTLPASKFIEAHLDHLLEGQEESLRIHFWLF